MSSYVLDCSLAMAWCFADQTDGVSTAALDALADESENESPRAVVPAIWPSEVLNVVLVAERHKKLTPAQSARFLQLLGSLPIDVDVDAASIYANAKILALGRSYRLSSYDASYLELAMRMGLPLATHDKKLAAACGAVGVKLVGR